MAGSPLVLSADTAEKDPPLLSTLFGWIGQGRPSLACSGYASHSFSFLFVSISSSDKGARI